MTVSNLQARILIVDDEADSLDLMKTVLTHCDAQVTTARSAAEAFAVVNSNPPEVLISDIEMPHEDGYSLISRIRALPRDDCHKLIAIALTAHANEKDKTRALTAGFDVHVGKPVEPVELVGAISSLIRSHAATE